MAEACQMPPLTDSQKEFLRQCEEDFTDRFTDSDPEYVAVRDRTKPLPPIVDPWASGSFGNRNRDRGDSYRQDNRDRGDRYRQDYRDRDYRRNRYGRDNYHNRYSNLQHNDGYNRYNRSPYSSNYRK